eukprot:scaffold33705_cov20-Tisochrysis_lutea.AAC.4
MHETSSHRYSTFFHMRGARAHAPLCTKEFVQPASQTDPPKSMKYILMIHPTPAQARWHMAPTSRSVVKASCPSSGATPCSGVASESNRRVKERTQLRRSVGTSSRQLRRLYSKQDCSGHAQNMFAPSRACLFQCASNDCCGRGVSNFIKPATTQ